MEASITHRPSGALLWFSRVLAVLSGLLILLTIVAVPIGVLVATGHGSIDLDVRFEPPYSIGFDTADTGFPAPADSGRRIDVGDDGTTDFVNFPIGEESRELNDAPSVRGKLDVDREDRDTRGLLLVLVVTWLVLAWVGLESLRRVVASARAGDPFDGHNVARLQRLGGALLIFPVVTWILLRLVDGALDSSVDVSPASTGTPGWIVAVIGVGVLALSEVFRAGTELRELEQTTV